MLVGFLADCYITYITCFIITFVFEQIYLNLQTHARVSLMNFNFNDTSCWLPIFSKKNPAPLGGFQNGNYTYRASYNTRDLRLNIEHKIMKKFRSWRAMRKTIWNRSVTFRYVY